MKPNSKLLFVIILLNFSLAAVAQTYILPNEIPIISFETKNNKFVMVAKDKDNKYMIYRFGTKDKVEFEFPDKNEMSWKIFKYSHYYRGGGKQNLAMELSTISFVNENYQYKVYDSYYSESDEYEIGVTVANLKTEKVTDIKGNLNTKKGQLNSFEGSDLLETDDEN